LEGLQILDEKKGSIGQSKSDAAHDRVGRDIERMNRGDPGRTGRADKMKVSSKWSQDKLEKKYGKKISPAEQSKEDKTKDLQLE